MDLFFGILDQITLPIVLVAAVGYLLQRRLGFDVKSFNRLQVHAILPCFLIYYLSTAKLPLAAVQFTAWFTVAQFIVMVILGWGASVLLRVPETTRPVLALTAAFANSGNFGIPVAELAFGKEYLLHQAVIVSLHSVLITSLGVVLLSHGRSGWLAAIGGAFRTPMIPAVALGLVLRLMEMHLPPPIAIPVQIIGSAYTPIALLALGAQLAMSKYPTSIKPLGLGLVLRLILAPTLTWLAVAALDVPHGLASLLIVTASAPTGVLLAILCSEYQNNEDLASALVFVSTVLSPLFVTAAIFATRQW